MAVKVLAKFRLHSVETAYGETAPAQKHVKLHPVLDEANKGWAKFTPGGSLELWIDNPVAMEAFQGPGDFKITIERLEPGEVFDPK